jgi:hypothetical protein
MHLTVSHIKVLALQAKLFMDYFLGVPLGGRLVLHAFKMADFALKIY